MVDDTMDASAAERNVQDVVTEIIQTGTLGDHTVLPDSFDVSSGKLISSLGGKNLICAFGP